MYELIEVIAKSYSQIELQSIANKIGIDKYEYTGDSLTYLENITNFIEITIRKELENNLIEILQSEKYYRKRINNIINQSDSLYKYNILHLSDIHISNQDEVENHLFALESDLKNKLNTSSIDFLLVSGDVVEKATTEEFDNALFFFNKLIERLNINKNKILLCPGNHDLDWKKTKSSMSDKNTIENTDTYKEKFLNFKSFYESLKEKSFDLDFKEQSNINIFDDEKVIFLELNSSWNIDHLNRSKASINGESIAKSLSNLLKNDYSNYLKVCLFHHPINHLEGMKDEFMELLIENDFKFCFHGHIHTASKTEYSYNYKNLINVIGCGTFSCDDTSMIPGIPLQYNFVEVYNNKLKINTRRKERRMGSWMPDSRWNNNVNPDPFYELFY